MPVLTAIAVAKYKQTHRSREIPDAGARSLRLVVYPSGAKSWIMRFRRPNGRSAKLTLGTVDTGSESAAEPVIGGHLTLAAARKLAAEVHRQRALGRDPVSELKAVRQRRKVEVIERERTSYAACARQFMLEHAIPKTRNWKATARLLGLTTPDLEPRGGGLAERWSDRLVATITPDDIHSLVNEARKYGVPGIERRVKGTTEQMARSMHSVLSKFFAWLVSQRVISVSPCHGLERPKPAAPRDRVLSDDEIRQFWRACDAIGPPFGPLFKVLLITGQRKSEVAGMTRDELNGTMWTIPKERSKNRRAHTVPLPPFARKLIASVEQGDRYVFTTTGHGPVKGFSTTKDRLRLAIPSWTLHDLRRTAAVGMARAGADLHVIERTLNHTSGSFAGIVGVYQLHKYADEIKMALEKWERLLLDIVR